MKKTRRQVVNLGVGSLVSTGALGAGLAGALAQSETPRPAAGTAAGDAATRTPLPRPDIDLIAAQETALEGHAGAAVRSIQLENEHGFLFSEVALRDGAEVGIDATTGQIMEAGESGSEGDETGEEDADSEEDENGGQNEDDENGDGDDDRDQD